MCIKIQTQFWLRKSTVGHPPCPVLTCWFTVPHNKETATPCDRVQNSLTSSDWPDWALSSLTFIFESCSGSVQARQLSDYPIADFPVWHLMFGKLAVLRKCQNPFFYYYVQRCVYFLLQSFRFQANSANTIVYFRLSWQAVCKLHR